MNKILYNKVSLFALPIQIYEIESLLNRPYAQVKPNPDNVFEMKEFKYSNPVFSFWNIKNNYDSSGSFYDNLYQLNWLKNNMPESNYLNHVLSCKESEDWTLKFWGVKDDIAVHDEAESNIRLSYNSDTQISYEFETKDYPVIQALIALSREFPQVAISYIVNESEFIGERFWLEGGCISLIHKYNNKHEKSHPPKRISAYGM